MGTRQLLETMKQLKMNVGKLVMDLDTLFESSEQELSEGSQSFFDAGARPTSKIEILE